MTKTQASSVSAMAGAAPLRTPSRTLVFALFFASGATALVYQTVWVRSLTLVFGASHEAVGIVLAAFMGGLALGGFVFGRLAERWSRPLRVYGLLELGIALVACGLPWLLNAVDAAYVERARAAGGITPGLHVLRAVLAGGVLLLPTALMGGTLPVLARLMVARREQFGLRLSQLYGINTAGAVVGALGAGFVALPELGLRGTELLAVAVNLVIAGAALWADRGLAPLEGEAAESGAASSSAAAPGAGGSLSTPVPTTTRDACSVWALRLTFWGTAVAGMVALALEVMWMRAISVVVGTTTYSFTVMLSAFLVGIALGSGLHAAFPLRKVGIARQFGWVLSGIGVLALVYAQAMPHLPRLAVALNAALYPDAAGLRVGTALFTSFAVMLLPCVLMGVAFPLAAEAGAGLRARVGRSVGDVVGLNTLGAIVGSVLAGFVLVPQLGLQRGMLLVAALDLAYGLLVLGLSWAGATQRARSTADAPAHAGRSRRATEADPEHAARPRPTAVLTVTAALMALVAALPFMLPDWDVRVLATFRNNDRGATDWSKLSTGADVLYYAEGHSSNVSVIESGPVRGILIDGKSVASDSLTDMQHELLLGHLPVLLHPAPRSAAVIGLGAGITLGSVLAHPEFERVVLVEIEPAVLDGARHFAHVNGGAVDDPRLEVVFQDGRNHLRTTAEQFDVITADPIHPWARGASYLYTAEYYAIARERLKPGGIMCQWLPLYELSGENVAAVIATFADSFAHTSLWQTAYDAVLIGSEAPLSLPADIAARMAAPAVARQLGSVGLDNPAALLHELTLDQAGMDALSADAPRNTDDNLYLEFSSPLSVGTPEVLDNIRRFNALRADVTDSFPQLEAWLDADTRAAWRAAKSATLEEQIALQQLRGATASASLAPLVARLSALIARTPDYGRVRSLASQALVDLGLRQLDEGRDQQGVDTLAAAVKAWPANAEAQHQLAVALMQRGRPDRALDFFGAALSLRPGDARIEAHHGAALLQLDRNAEARAVLEAVAAARPYDAEVHHNAGIAALRTGDTAAAEAHLLAARARNPERAGLATAYSMLLIETGRHAAALAQLEDGLAAHPDELPLRRQLAWLLATAPNDTLRDGPRALQLAEALNTATGGNIPEVLDTLGAALAEVGRMAEATARCERAAELAQAAGQPDLARAISERADHYRTGEAWRLIQSQTLK